METLKRNLINLGKGFIVWFILLLLNTRSNEAAVNGIKILLDVILASMIISENRTGRRIALLTTALTILITILQMPSGVEIILLIGLSLFSLWLLKKFPDDRSLDESPNYEDSTALIVNEDVVWKAKNVFNPFEYYTYSPDNGVCIRKGILRRSYSTIPTTTTRVEITQFIWQRIFGLCEVTFVSNFSGQKFGDKSMKNVRLKAAGELMRML